MARLREVSLLFLLCVFGLFATPSTDFALTTGESLLEKPASGFVYASYTDHTPIDIRNDTALAFFAVSGAGTMGNPYILGGWNITTDGEIAIQIYDTTDYFVIEDCWIDTGGLGGATGIYVRDAAANTTVIRDIICQNTYYGIYVYNVDYAEVYDSTCNSNKEGIRIQTSYYPTVWNCTSNYNSWFGIYMRSSTYSNVTNCIANRNNYNSMYGSGIDKGIGIIAEFSSYSHFVNNTCNENADVGIYVTGASVNATIRDNVAIGNDNYGIENTGSIYSVISNNTAISSGNAGIRIGSDNSTISNNTVSDNADGMWFTYVDFNTIVNNTFVDDGLNLLNFFIDDYAGHIVEDNLVNGHPLGFFVNEEDTIHATQYGQVIMINCTRVTVQSQDCSNTSTGFYVRWSTDCELLDSIADYNDKAGIHLIESDNILIENVNASYNVDPGCHVENSDDSRILDCVLEGNEVGVRLATANNLEIINSTISNNNEAYLSPLLGMNTTVEGNTFVNEGLSLYGVTVEDFLSYNDTIRSNTVNGNPLGLYVSATDIDITSPHGQIFLINCTNVQVTNQDCSNTAVGIGIYHSSVCSLADSDFSDNSRDGIHVLGSYGSEILRTTGSNNDYSGANIDTSVLTEVTDSTFRNNWRGVNVLDSDYTQIEGCELAANDVYGVIVTDTTYVTIAQSEANNNGYSGILLDGCAFPIVRLTNSTSNAHFGIGVDTCSGSLIESNNCSSNAQYGIYVDDSPLTTVVDNICDDNTLSGIYIYSSIFTVDNSTGCRVTGNRVFRNAVFGIHAKNADTSSVTYNFIYENQDYGIYLENCEDTVVHHCIVIDNNVGLGQASDNGSLNSVWFDFSTAEGNYWSDYSGVGSYSIDGTTGVTDIYPLITSDVDGDGLSDIWEILNGLSPLTSDSDGDSMDDGYEVAHGLDPTTDDSSGDLDADGLTNLEEYGLGTRADSKDADSDGMVDGWKVRSACR
ncbi:MAG: right-handed parallel beta-helix repeat-containing protein [Candidatus Thorarchaeota archaeon]|jgi:parallel beta-helix repeat protein